MDQAVSQSLRFARKAFFVFALNGVAASLGVALATICDAVVVGNAFGETGLAITSVVMPVYMLYNFISFSIGVGGSTAVSLALGREDPPAAQAVFSQCLTLAVGGGVLLAAAGLLFLPSLVALLGGGLLGPACPRYVGTVILGAPFFVAAPVLSLMIRADGDPKRSTAGITLSSAVNLALDLVFISVLRVGVEGAAWAMVIGQACAVAVYLPHFLPGRYVLRLRPTRPSLAQAAQVVGAGMGTASYYAWQFLYLSVFNNLLSRTSGQQGLAVFNLVFNVGMLAYAFFDGISLTIPPLAGTYLGERDYRSLSYTVRLALKSALGCALALAALLFVFARPVVAFFGVTDPQTLSLGVAAARIYCAAIACTSMSSTLSACYQALGHPRLALGIHALRGCLFLLAAGVPMILVFGSRGVAPALVLAEALGLCSALLLAQGLRRRLGCSGVLLLPEGSTSDAVYEDVLDRDFRRLPEIVEAVEAFCQENEIDPAAAYSIQLTIEELAANIIQFGFQDNKSHFISFKVAKYDRDIYIRIRDDATNYNPFGASGDPSAGDDIDLLGVELVRKKAKDFLYQRRLIFNNLLIIL